MGAAPPLKDDIRPEPLGKALSERYLAYALSTITSRALPDVRDGLKPVQRRILYTMFHDLHLTFDGRPRMPSALTAYTRE